jgi:nudix-type nucleoside diphosphatase (YffH/AdpP family)
MSGSERATIVSAEVLSDDWAKLTKYTIDYRRRDGRSERQVRQVYDRGDGAAILPVDPERGTVLLVRQFRMPVAVNHERGGLLIEACAGKLDANDPETAIRKEAEEELGYRLKAVRKIYECYMSPGSVSERLSLFLASYSPADRVSAGGGELAEGEDIEVLEMPLDEAAAMMERSEIADAKTMILIQRAMREAYGLSEGEA